MALELFAGIRVRELAAARPWYEQLLGAASFFPNASEAVWTLADERSVYLQEDADRAGDALVTVWVDDLDGHATMPPCRRSSGAGRSGSSCIPRATPRQSSRSSRRGRGHTAST